MNICADNTRHWRVETKDDRGADVEWSWLVDRSLVTSRHGM